MTAPSLCDRLAQTMAEARPSIDFPPWDSQWERDRDHWREIASALLASEEWQVREAVVGVVQTCLTDLTLLGLHTDEQDCVACQVRVRLAAASTRLAAVREDLR